MSPPPPFFPSPRPILELCLVISGSKVYIRGRPELPLCIFFYYQNGMLKYSIVWQAGRCGGGPVAPRGESPRTLAVWWVSPSVFPVTFFSRPAVAPLEKEGLPAQLIVQKGFSKFSYPPLFLNLPGLPSEGSRSFCLVSLWPVTKATCVYVRTLRALTQ